MRTSRRREMAVSSASGSVGASGRDSTSCRAALAALTCGQAEALAAADSLGRVVRPAEGAEQEVYFNVRFFERP